MRKMKVYTFNGEYEIQEMTFENMHEVIAMQYDWEIASEVVRSDDFNEWIPEAMRFYWVEGSRIPGDTGGMEWIIEECMDIEIGEFEDEDEDAYDTPYYDAGLMQYMV